MKISLAETDAARKACFDIRRAVFIEEQQIPEAEEWDDHDATCLHYLAGEDAGTARVIAKGCTAKIGRVAVMQAHRGTGLGLRIMQTLMEDARARGFTQAELESQTYAVPFYARLGFVADGPEYDDGSGILHRLMRVKL
ncbi:GNAT family N-acetyltransferase [Rhodobacteraceae bacterium N5(2021)]|uniref:GNAT family N-acetyltransferase n=1 Tax=Gymnodinialimonas phycosphaerae TaxID=2841589 RepID=A0A975TTG6_9RHOB|nr:GNAT family N-acetyltransferase [Gymnodinialimonas phycosphaerae]MBY4894380.1 GNAT family N-acetyltransferase [Gymnodinialimonas phycosphaerae]